MSNPPLTPRSARVKEARRLTRHASRAQRRQFLVEGPQAVREALGVAGCVDDLFVTGEAIARHDDIAVLAAAASVDLTLSSDDAVAALAGSVSPQGMVAVCRFLDVALSDALGSDARLVAVGAHVRDPGNAGSLIRCADAAGADAVVFAGSSVDPYNDKAVRSSAGSIFHLPLVVGTTVAAVVGELRGHGFEILAADATGSQSLDESLDAGTLAGRVAWIFGNEAWGIPPDEVALADHAIAVPIYGRAESLNVSSAAAVCLYTTARAQRAGETR